MLPAKARLARRDAVVTLRALILRAAAAAVIAVGLVACGDEEADPGEPGGTTGTDITVTVDADGDGAKDPMVEDVSCAEGEDTRPCRALLAINPADLAPVSADQACTEIFGGPDMVMLTGTLRGEPLDVSLSRANGCEIKRFEEALPLLRALFPDYAPGSALR